jgi:hypothetical protein
MMHVLSWNYLKSNRKVITQAKSNKQRSQKFIFDTLKYFGCFTSKKEKQKQTGAEVKNWAKVVREEREAGIQTIPARQADPREKVAVTNQSDNLAYMQKRGEFRLTL